jgi:N-acyl-phosphatidylethanolamine-hydrolysing phospholipase D
LHWSKEKREKMKNNKQFNIHFKWIGSATWVLSINDLKIACDPVLCPKDTVQVYGPGSKSKRLTDPVFEESDFQNIDLWLISHEHEDHLDKYGLSKIDPEAIVVSNKKAGKIIQKIHPKQLDVVKQGQELSYDLKGLTVEIKVMPAVHASNFLMAYILGGGNGYWLNIRNKDAVLKIYITGDTISHNKVINALHGYKADILIPNIGAAFQNAFGGPYTFTTKTLQKIIDATRPDVILPVHFGTFAHFYESSTTVKEWNDKRVKIFSEGDCFKN